MAECFTISGSLLLGYTPTLLCCLKLAIALVLQGLRLVFTCMWDLKTLIHGGPRFGKPFRWAFEGTDSDGNLMLRFDNIPDDVWPITVLG